MKYPSVPKITLTVTCALLISALLGCAESKGWKGGNACNQIGKNQSDIQKIDDQVTVLRGKNSAAPSPDLDIQIQRLQEQRRDLELSSQKLAEDCHPHPVQDPLDKDVYPK
jgi:hypothetical protein